MLKGKLIRPTKNILILSIFVMALLLLILNLLLPNSVKANDIILDSSIELSNEKYATIDTNKDEFILNNDVINNNNNNEENNIQSTINNIDNAIETEIISPNNAIDNINTSQNDNNDFSDLNKINFNDYSNSADNICISKEIFNVCWGYPNCEKQAVKKTNDKVTIYKDIYKGIDIQYIEFNDKLEENIILKIKNIENSFYIKYTLTELNAFQLNNKTIELRNKDNQSIYTITAPIMTDANKIESNAIFLEIVEQKEDKFLLKILCDEIWLSDKDRIYPVIIDPNYKDKEINSNLNYEGVYYSTVELKETSSSIYLNIEDMGSKTIKVSVYGFIEGKLFKNCTHKREYFVLNKDKYELYNTCNEEGYLYARLVFLGLPNQLIKVKWSPDYFPEEGVLIAEKGNCKDIPLGTITLPYFTQGEYYKGGDSSVYIDLSNLGNLNTPIIVKILGCDCLNGADGNKSYFHGYINFFTIYTGYKYELYNMIFEHQCLRMGLYINSPQGNII